jgi:hypothetical protein
VDTTLLYPSKYISADDLKGRHIPVTISKLKREMLKRRNGEQEVKPILYFEETKKGLVVNVTNLKLIWSILGSKNSDDWTGKRVTLYSTPVQFGDQMMEGVRIAAVNKGNGANKQVAPAPAIDPSDDVPAFDIPDGDANEDAPEDVFK